MKTRKELTTIGGNVHCALTGGVENENVLKALIGIEVFATLVLPDTNNSV